MSFELPPSEVQWAFLWCVSAPVALLASRWLPIAAAQRFGVSAFIVLGSYLAVYLGWRFDPSRILPIVTGAALIIATLIFTLGIWGLLTRGYSIAMLIALASLGGSGRIDVLEKSYSGGRGLHWMADKRLRGLQAFGLVVVSDGWMIVTPAIGKAVFGLYKAFMKCFRLRQYG